MLSPLLRATMPCTLCRLECCKALLRAGADPNYVNGAGDLVLFWALDGGELTRCTPSFGWLHWSTYLVYWPVQEHGCWKVHVVLGRIETACSCIGQRCHKFASFCQLTYASAPACASPAAGWPFLLIYTCAPTKLCITSGPSLPILFAGVEVTKLLIEYGADMDCMTPKGWTPLSYAKAKGKYGATEEKGIYPEVRRGRLK